MALTITSSQQQLGAAPNMTIRAAVALATDSTDTGFTANWVYCPGTGQPEQPLPATSTASISFADVQVGAIAQGAYVRGDFYSTSSSTMTSTGSIPITLWATAPVFRATNTYIFKPQSKLPSRLLSPSEAAALGSIVTIGPTGTPTQDSVAPAQLAAALADCDWALDDGSGAQIGVVIGSTDVWLSDGAGGAWSLLNLTDMLIQKGSGLTPRQVTSSRSVPSLMYLIPSLLSWCSELANASTMPLGLMAALTPGVRLFNYTQRPTADQFFNAAGMGGDWMVIQDLQFGTQAVVMSGPDLGSWVIGLDSITPPDTVDATLTACEYQVAQAVGANPGLWRALDDTGFTQLVYSGLRVLLFCGRIDITNDVTDFLPQISIVTGGAISTQQATIDMLPISPAPATTEANWVSGGSTSTTTAMLESFGTRDMTAICAAVNDDYLAGAPCASGGSWPATGQSQNLAISVVDMNGDITTWDTTVVIPDFVAPPPIAPELTCTDPASVTVVAGATAFFGVQTNDPEATVTWQTLVGDSWIAVQAWDQAATASVGGQLAVPSTTGDMSGQQFRATAVAGSGTSGIIITDPAVLSVTAGVVRPPATQPSQTGLLVGAAALAALVLATRDDDTPRPPTIGRPALGLAEPSPRPLSQQGLPPPLIR